MEFLVRVRNKQDVLQSWNFLHNRSNAGKILRIHERNGFSRTYVVDLGNVTLAQFKADLRECGFTLAKTRGNVIIDAAPEGLRYCKIIFDDFSCVLLTNWKFVLEMACYDGSCLIEARGASETSLKSSPIRVHWCSDEEEMRAKYDSLEDANEDEFLELLV